MKYEIEEGLLIGPVFYFVPFEQPVGEIVDHHHFSTNLLWVLFTDGLNLPFLFIPNIERINLCIYLSVLSRYYSKVLIA